MGPDGLSPPAAEQGGAGDPTPSPRPLATGAPPGPPPAPGNGMAVASLVLGIVSLCAWIFSWLGLLVAVPGLVLGILAKGKGGPRQGLAIAGIVTSSIGLALAIIVIIVTIAYGDDLLAWVCENQPDNPAC